MRFVSVKTAHRTLAERITRFVSVYTARKTLKERKTHLVSVSAAGQPAGDV